jgi:BMFP domain-containing protein YqiC
MLSSIKNAVNSVKTKVAQKAMENMDMNDPKVKEMIDEQLNKMGVPPQFKEMFKKLMQNKPELLMKIAQETEAAMKGGMSQIAAAQSVMMKYQKDLRDAMK